MPYRHWETKLRKQGIAQAIAKQDACPHPRPREARRTNNLYEVVCPSCGAALRTYTLLRAGEWKLIASRPGYRDPQT
jgi:hypothetical protein